MIQILGYRQVFNETLQTYATAQTFLTKNWRAETIPELFIGIHEHLAKIPHEERYNLHYTVCKCMEHQKNKRVFESQSTIPWDIDGIDVTQIEKYHSIILKEIGNLSYDEVGIVCSGNGIHYLVETDIVITDITYFEATRGQYGLVCDKINGKLMEAGLPGHADVSLWAPAHTLRLPSTENRKTEATGYKGRNDVTQCYLIQPKMALQKNYAIHLLEKDSAPAANEQLSIRELSRFPAPDTGAVLEGCHFLQHCRDNAVTLTEPEWYAMLSVVSRLEDGHLICHRISERHQGYSPRETDIKINHALRNSGPRTCKNISTLWGGCKDCPHLGTIASPILIRGANYIATKDSGFYNMIFDDKTGALKVGKPNYDDLLKHFRLQYDFFVDENKNIFTWNGRHWSMLSDIHIEAFAEDNFKPAPTNAMCVEFLTKIHRNNVRNMEFISTSTEKKINLLNGILDFTKGYPELLPPNKDVAFMYCAEYNYDARADCPRFKQFMAEITLGRKELEYIILEFIAYALMDVECKEQVALILFGDGANGKSTLLEVIKGLVGRQAYSILNLEQLSNEQHAASLQGKLFNLSEETPKDSLVDSSHFKNIVSGGEISVKTVYKPPYIIRNRAKIIVAANTLPTIKDNTHGLWRRFKIIPFDATFSKSTIDKNLKEKLRNELPGILNLVLEAYARYINQNGFSESVVIDETVTEYRQENSVNEFFDDTLKITNNSSDFFAFNDLYAKYIRYCELNFISFTKSPKTISAELKTYLKSQKWKGEATRKYFDGTQKKGYSHASLAKIAPY